MISITNKPKILQYENYLAMINNSIGSEQYQTLWGMWENGNKEDLTKGGELSCAVFVTSILKLFDLVDKQKATVKGAVELMKETGWKLVEKQEIKEGDVIVWKRKTKNDAQHAHIGFYVGNKKAISNSSKLKKVVRHSWDYGGKREIVEVWRWDKW